MVQQLFSGLADYAGASRLAASCRSGDPTDSRTLLANSH